MKKLFFVAAFAVVSLASCSKDHTCTCTMTMDGDTETEVFQFPDSKKKDANTACLVLQASWKAEEPTATCKLD